MIIVTGATGFIGSAIVWELNTMGRDDIIVCDPVKEASRPGILKKRNFERFLGKDELLTYLYEENPKDIEWIVHMGACSSTTEMDQDFLKENNTDYTRKLFEWCRDNGAQFIYASSGAVYGDGQQGFDDQVDPDSLTPLNPYGNSKLNFDSWVLKEKQFPEKWMGLRFFNVYGPNEYFKKDMSSVVFKAYRQISVNSRLKLFRSHNEDYADGEQMRDFVYVKDITRWIGEIISGKGYSGIYNMGYGQARPWNALAGAVFKNMNKDMQIDWVDVPEDIRPRYQYYTEAKMDRFLSMDFSKPEWSLEKGIEDYIGYLRKDDPFL